MKEFYHTIERDSPQIRRIDDINIIRKKRVSKYLGVAIRHNLYIYIN